MAQHDERGQSMTDEAESVDIAVRSLLDRLRRRRDDIADAVAGRPLRVAVDLGEPGEPPVQSYRITFTREGHVMSRSGREFVPHLELRGTTAQVESFVRGDISTTDARSEGVLILHIPSSEAAGFGRLRALVAEELAPERVVVTRGT